MKLKLTLAACLLLPMMFSQANAAYDSPICEKSHQVAVQPAPQNSLIRLAQKKCREEQVCDSYGTCRKERVCN